MQNIHWLWLDANCFNKENTLLYKSFLLIGLNVKRFKDFEELKDEYDRLQMQITSAGANS